MEIRRFEQRCFDQRYNERVRKLADRFHEGIIASPLTARIDDSLRVVLSSRLVSTEVASIGVVAQALVDCVSTSWCYAVAADDESSRVHERRQWRQKGDQRQCGRAFSSLPTEIYIHCICFSTFSPRLSPFMLFSVRIFPFLLTHGEPEVRTLSILIVNPPRWASILRWILVSFFFFFFDNTTNWKYMELFFLVENSSINVNFFHLSLFLKKYILQRV